MLGDDWNGAYVIARRGETEFPDVLENMNRVNRNYERTVFKSFLTSPEDMFTDVRKRGREKH